MHSTLQQPYLTSSSSSILNFIPLYPWSKYATLVLGGISFDCWGVGLFRAQWLRRLSLSYFQLSALCKSWQPDQIQPFTYAFLLSAGDGSGNLKDTEKFSTDSSMLGLPGMIMSVDEARWYDTISSTDDDAVWRIPHIWANCLYKIIFYQYIAYWNHANQVID